MFIDASALVAVLLDEPDADALIDRFDEFQGQLRFSALTRYEAAISLARAKTLETNRKPAAEMIETALKRVDGLLAELGAEEVPIAGSIGTLAVEAAARYGKAVAHAADLNFGDCFSYACAKSLGTRLIYKGNDFALTDLA
ncbi:ribonuclease VapC30 [Variibacter gotjawalensis]|uniref:Ribonuclease VapC n=1 Tax=Variibacter gotjawalensis TaxID=1333996 RepID=A0A0S3PVV5_9BRAD|nr:type II toxin-antitoxin system VapC family toxin [Variibacter gotjawalensis]NIK45820.1 ribonuclease VapC [Variibacter gotjawalensis]RZS47744.1 ribonuclease VapC [Variibacter gotjawalensis]BAT59998.1 ribonuclease VapC30 [Variibacter gotjawalensis]